MDVKRFQYMPMYGERNWVYDIRSSVDRVLAFAGSVKLWRHCGGHSAALRLHVVNNINMPFTLCTEEEPFTSRLMLIVRNGSEMFEAVPVTCSLEYVVFPRPFDSLHFLTNFEYC